MSEQQAKVHTEHPEANTAIEKLREVAATLQQVGNKLTHTHTDKLKLQEEVEKLTQRLAELEDEAAQGAEALSAMDDFRLGLCDKDEMLKRVFGRT